MKQNAYVARVRQSCFARQTANSGLLGAVHRLQQSIVEAIRLLRVDRMRIVMFTSYNCTSALALTGQFGLDEVEVEVLPDHKHDVMRWLRDRAALRRHGRRRREWCPSIRRSRCRYCDGNARGRDDRERRHHAGQGRPARDCQDPAA